ncbi:MAG TPA: phosphatidate cytidylyltransferase [Rhizomicrobium sp.]|jgi:phosphatidate cytidylyltransferase
MSAQQANVSTPARAPGAPNISEKWELPLRIVLGFVLAGLAIASLFGDTAWFALFVGVGAAAAVREWHRMRGVPNYAIDAIFNALGLIGGLVALVLLPHSIWPWIALVAGATMSALSGALRGGMPLWNFAGGLYIAGPSMLLVAMRAVAARGAWIVLGVFLVVWAADTGALVCGKVIGGPKFMPALSPNKTWAGFIGGIVVPAAVIAAYVGILGGRPIAAALFGGCMAAIGHAGDLFESSLKRSVGRKNTGNLLPGHGGVLDRIDSILFVAPVAALLYFGFHIDLLFGATP